ncbi:hypothetical protein A2U01_0115583, partial [Trifolium medium]|nr:hypothetical protein [Trifolium medium]
MSVDLSSDNISTSLK